MGAIFLEKFLWIQAIVVVVGILYLLRRTGPGGARLRWKKGESRVAPAEMEMAPRQWKQPSNGKAQEDEERSLNIHFMYNGHSWDAFEVLGLPAGSSREKVEEAYQKATSSAEPDSRELYAQAREAILGNHR